MIPEWVWHPFVLTLILLAVAMCIVAWVGPTHEDENQRS